MKKTILGTLIFLAIPLVSYASIDTNDLSYGMTDSTTGGPVTLLQQYLVSAGYLSTTPTGHFGSATLAAVETFQSEHGMPSTGYVGALTRAAINANSASQENSTTIISPVSPTTICPQGYSCAPTTSSVQPQATVVPVQTSPQSCTGGFTFDKSVNECVTNLVYCQNRNGTSATYNSANNSCGCATGYTLNSNNTCSIPESGYQICSEEYPNATWDGTYGNNGKYNCVCPTGYTMNGTQTACQVQQYQVTQPIGISNTISQQAIQSSIDGEFDGWTGETLYKLINGQYWQQSSYHYYYQYAYNPKVLIYVSDGSYKMHVEGDDDQDVSVVPISNVLESQIDGEFDGWNGDTAYTLVNGQVWQQTDYHYHYHYAYSPQVIIYQSNSGAIKMHVNGDDDQEISVRRIN